MTTYTLKKGNTEILIRITPSGGEEITRVGGNTSTSRKELTKFEANRRVNDLLREGYARVTAASVKVKEKSQK